MGGKPRRSKSRDLSHVNVEVSHVEAEVAQSLGHIDKPCELSHVVAVNTKNTGQF